MTEGADVHGEVDFGRFAGPMENTMVADWKASGGHVVGYFCCHAPEELLTAGGILPVRMRGTGSTETGEADRYLGAVNCGFVRHTLNRLLSGHLDVLDGVIVTNSCDHIRRLSDVCADSNAVPFCASLDVPHVDTPEARARLAEQLRALRGRLESAFGIEIPDEKITAAVRLHNRTRELLSRASSLRCEDPPRIKGSEILRMSVAAASMPKDAFNDLLEKRLAQIELGHVSSSSSGPRLMIVGGMLDDPAYLEVFESMGAEIVADQLCCGSKSFSCRTAEDGDPIDAIAQRMLRDMPCPRMVSEYPKRLASIGETIASYRVDAVVCERLKFCDLWGGEASMLRQSFREEIRLPLLVLERDYLTAGLGQLRTRVQAFLETLGA